MRNRWGVDVKKGHWVRFSLPRGGQAEDNVSRVEREPGRGYVVTLESGRTVALDDVSVSMGPMTVGRGGVVNQNPITEARELFLYSLNNRDIYKLSQAAAMSPRGDWGAVARLAAKEYSAEHGSGPTKWREIFSLDDTRVVASMLREHYTELGDVSANPTPRLKRYDQDSQREHFNPKTGKMTKRATARLKERRTQTHYNAPPGVWANPLVRVKVKSPAQRGKAAPSERLIARRKVTQKAPPGFYGNPLSIVPFGQGVLDTAGSDTMRDFGEYFFVQWKNPGDKTWTTQRIFQLMKEAETYARAMHRNHPDSIIRVVKQHPKHARK